MYTVYILKDIKGKLYRGMTNNFERRFAEHKRGKTIATKRMSHLRIVYKEEFSNFKEAREREEYFKTAAGRRFLKTKKL